MFENKNFDNCFLTIQVE